MNTPPDYVKCRVCRAGMLRKHSAVHIQQHREAGHLILAASKTERAEILTHALDAIAVERNWCPRCGGTGDAFDWDADEWVRPRRDCETCNGTGAGPDDRRNQ